MPTSVAEAAEKRAAAAVAMPGDKLGRADRSLPPGNVREGRESIQRLELRTDTVSRDGKDYLTTTGYATVYDEPYEMYDWAGPYNEVVSRGAGATSLASSPQVVYQVNHGGNPFASTRNNTLDLAEDDTGLAMQAFLNPQRQDAKDHWEAVRDGTFQEMSFMFRIDQGQWSPDYTEYRINQYDINRGDVSPVTYGANPATSIEARAAQLSLANHLARALPQMDDDQRAMLRERLGDVPEDAPVVEPARLGARAIADLRLLRASVDQDALDPVSRATLAAVLDDLIEGTGRLAGGDGALPVLLQLRTEIPAPPAAAQPSTLSLDLAVRDLTAAGVKVEK
jgi:HK97 family phage prohead protease